MGVGVPAAYGEARVEQQHPLWTVRQAVLRQTASVDSLGLWLSLPASPNPRGSRAPVSSRRCRSPTPCRCFEGMEAVALPYSRSVSYTHLRAHETRRHL
eukprot:1022754-Prorocentrum_lima.AAC.1